jgi:hypothetical protein
MANQGHSIGVHGGCVWVKRSCNNEYRMVAVAH